MFAVLTRVYKRALFKFPLPLYEECYDKVSSRYFHTSSRKREKNPKNSGLPPSAFVTKQGMNNHTKNASVSFTNANITKSVFISQSNDIFTNLALEDWLYRHFDFRSHHVLLLWVNDPCVVIGRHQNPFMEANISKLESQGVTVARRNSGGGAVYHDRGNLNCTFFTPRERYNRKYNLNVLTRALFREWAIKSEINERDDVCVSGKKLSGTAAKLGYPNAYHHCTLLANTDKLSLGNCLSNEKLKETNKQQIELLVNLLSSHPEIAQGFYKGNKEILNIFWRKVEEELNSAGSPIKSIAELKRVNYISKSTPSVRSPIKNLCELNRNVNISQLISAVGYEYLRTFATELEDGGHQQIMKQRGFQLINPTDKWFPGINDLRTEFNSWEWIYGKTPKFSVEQELLLKDKQHKIILNVEVEKGLINDVTITMPNNERLPVVSSLQNQCYNEWNLNKIISALKLASTDNILQAINGH